MKFKIGHLVGLLLIVVLPMRIVPVSNDTTETSFYLSGHSGHFAHIQRGCEGNVVHKEELSLKEISGGFDRTITAPVRIGVRGSYIFTEKPSEFYEYGYEFEYEQQPVLTGIGEREIFAVNPFMDLEWKKFGLGGGFLFANNALPGSEDNFDRREIMPSGYVRFGSYKKLYMDAALFHSIPLVTGGYSKLGLGSKGDPNFDWWLGIGGGSMYDAAGILAKTNIKLHPTTSLDFFARLGGSEGISESAVGIGLTFRVKSNK